MKYGLAPDTGMPTTVLYVFPEAQLLTTEHAGDDMAVAFWITGQPQDLVESQVRQGSIDRVHAAGAEVDVQNVPFKDYNNKLTHLETIELNALLLRAALGHEAVTSLTGYNTGYIGVKGDRQPKGPLLRAYDKLLPSEPKTRRSRRYSIERSIRFLFENELLVTRRKPDLHDINTIWRDRLFALTGGLAVNRSFKEIRDEQGWSNKAADKISQKLRDRLHLSLAGLCFVAEADRHFTPSNQIAMEGVPLLERVV